MIDLQAARNLVERCIYDDTIGADELLQALAAAMDEIDRLRDCLIEERASKKISLFCNCESCWPMGTPKPPRRIAAEEKVRQEARQQLEAEGKI